MKKWGVVTIDQQKRRQRGAIISPFPVYAKSRKEAKLTFLKQFPGWSMAQVAAHPMEEK